MNQVKTFNDVQVFACGPVAVVRFERPPHNYFNFDLLVSLADAFDFVDAQPDFRASVLASQGRIFCAGGNFNDSNVDVADQSLSDRIYRVAMRLYRVGKPIVAAIQGAAIGGGLGLALVADFRVAAGQARLSANFAQLGIHAGFGMTATLPSVVGHQNAALLLYTGRRITAEHALEIGLVDVLAGPEGALHDAIELAKEIASSAPLAVHSMRKAHRESLIDRVQEAVLREAQEQVWQFQTADFEEGLNAMTERRPPVFRGK